MDKKRSVVTGATGLVGSHLVAELVRRGATDITLPVRDASRLDRLHRTLAREGVDASGVRLRVVETELTDPIALKEAFEGVDTVYNCAAAVSLGAMDETALIEGNIAIAKHVVNACLAAGVGKLVHVSSIAALGSAAEGEEYIDESRNPESLAAMPAYYAGKFLSENEVWRGVACGLRAVVVNPAVVLGAGDWRTGSTAMIPTMASGVPFYTDGVTAMVDVRDVARAMIDLGECAAAEGERFILAGQNIGYREFLTLAAQAAGKRPPRFKVGGALLGAAWRGARLWERITGSRLLFTRDVAQALMTQTFYTTDKIRRTIGFEFTPLALTIDRVVKQYLAERNG
ncbi:NAD-dependent epimerase/dehydratase family protein [Alistipes sp. OttesenSCG-928-B03]|nr:NAD-dependent epimerase/dehydratase family protein [Alistipes sp. OttesenSCG-928-B03]